MSGGNPEGWPARQAKLSLGQHFMELMEFNLLEVALQRIVDAVPAMGEARRRILWQLGRELAPACESFLDKGFLRSILGGFIHEAHHAQDVKGLGERKRSLTAIEGNDRGDTDAGQRRVLTLCQFLGLAAPQGFVDQCAPVEWRYSPNILRHAPSTISA